jgi:hypothetical protein
LKSASFSRRIIVE